MISAQHEEARFKVMKGREVHEKKLITNPDYLRKKLGVVKKEMNVFMASKQHHIKGIADEVLFLDDGTAAPFDTSTRSSRIRSSRPTSTNWCSTRS